MRKFVTPETWIRDALSDADKQGPCTMLALVHKRSEGGTREVHAIPIAGKTWEPKQLADALRGRAETYAQDLPGLQHFEILAFYGSQDPSAFYPFSVVDGELNQGAHWRPKEDATPTGLTAQLMRHNERNTEMLQQLVLALSRTSIEREQTLFARERELHAELGDAFKIVREMTLQMGQDMHALRMKELEYARMTAERAQLMKIAPTLINQISGREIIPQSAQDSALLDLVSEHLDPEQVKQIAQLSGIPQEVVTPFVLRLAEARDRKKREEEAAAKAKPPIGGDFGEGGSAPAQVTAGSNGVAGH